MPENVQKNISNPGGVLTSKAPVIVKAPLYIQALKITSVITLLASILASMYFSFDLNPGNQYLSLVGYDNNTKTLHDEIKSTHGTTSRTKFKLAKEDKELRTKIETKDYSENTTQIKQIRSKQITWFDRIGKDKKFQIGLFNIPTHLGDYVNQRQLDDVLGADNNNIVIENITANRTNVSFSFEASSPYKKVFNLTNEFIHLINGLTTLKGVQVSSFTRTENEEGYESMSFSVNAQIQQAEDIDTSDDEDINKDFTDWVQANSDLTNTRRQEPVPEEPKAPILRRPLPRN